MKKLIICILSFLFMNMAFGLPKDEPCAKELEISNCVDSMIDEANKFLPITISDNVFEQINRSGKDIYITDVLTKYNGYKINDVFLNLKEKALLPMICTSQELKLLSENDYKITAIYYTPERKEIYRRTLILKDICASFQ